MRYERTGDPATQRPDAKPLTVDSELAAANAVSRALSEPGPVEIVVNRGPDGREPLAA